MQLVAYGAQDVYLTGNPQITFWKVTYRRHTNFALESIEQTFNGQADFGRRVTCTISRNGDLAYRTYFQVTLPEINQQMHNPLGGSILTRTTNVSAGDTVTYGAAKHPGANNGVYARWLDFPGEHMISAVEVEIGGQRIDRQYGDWMHIWNQLTLSKEQERGYYKMVGNTTQLTFITDPSFADIDGPCDSNAPRQVCAPRKALPETTLYIPFQFWYCRNPGLALPLIALQYHEVKINLDIRPIDEMLWAVETLECDELGTNKIPGSGSSGGQGTTYGATPPAYGQSVKVTTAYNQSLVAASLYVDYVFLDTDERRRMAQNPHEYLIEQLQFTGDESVGSSSNKIKLNFNHPCKELIFVVQSDANVDYCSSLECGTTLYRLFGAQPFNYTDAVDALPNCVHAFGGPLGVAETENAFINASGLFSDPGSVDVTAAEFWNQPAYATTGLAGGGNARGAANAGGGYSSGGGGPPNTSYGQKYNSNQRTGTGLQSPPLPAGAPAGPGFNKHSGVHYDGGLDDGGGLAGGGHISPEVVNSGVSDAGTFVMAETSLDMHCWGENPVVTAKLQLNGQDRFSEREGTYFDLVQPYQHHTRSPDTGINVYSFSLRPEEHQPSGTCNFSRIDNATLQLVLSNATVEGTSTAKVRVYATNYNVLRVMSGMGGLAYSN